MTSYIITIAVDPPGLIYTGSSPSSGNFVYGPARLNVAPGDQITWSCNNPFSLEFKGNPPIANAQVFGNINTGTQYYTNPCNVGPVNGSFHYAVAVYATPAGSSVPQIFMDGNCPAIVVSGR